MAIILPFILLFVGVTAAMDQAHFPTNLGWKAELSKSWDVLGPFPIHAREQQFLSPSYPITISEPINFTRTWPSSYADNGRVGWTKTQATADGDLKVSFPGIRWSDLRATEGWAALQHHAVLHINLTLYPTSGSNATPPRLLVQLVQGSYIAIVPEASGSESSSPPEWHAGNIYALERTLPRAIDLPTPPSTTSPTTYHVFVSGDYEIRLFGAPRIGIPTQAIKLTIDIETPKDWVQLEPTQDVVCDFVDGYAFGDAIGVGVRSLGGWWTVIDAVLSPKLDDFAVELLSHTTLAPSQTRIIPLHIIQTAQFTRPTLSIKLTLTSSDTNRTLTLPVVHSVKHLPAWSSGNLSAISGTYFYGQEMPTAFSAFPPLLENTEHQEPQPPILCLHGAGVDIASPFWIDSLPRQQHSWLVTPSGRTAWVRAVSILLIIILLIIVNHRKLKGLDWHGPSAKDAWGSVDALVAILAVNPSWHTRKLADGMRVVLMGHSNGGQGAWYLASRFPDRVLGVVPAAAYIKSQSYVPLIMSRSAHFIDPAVRAILESSLTPDDNDLFLSNLVDMPVLAVHGGNDDNVPVWHSREAVNVLLSWNAEANVTEDPRQLHWYPSVLKNNQVQTFLDDVLQKASHRRPRSKTFTLTVAVPAESGSLHGWRIERLSVPGRLGRLTVDTLAGNEIRIVTSNVDRFSISTDVWDDIGSLRVDNAALELQQDPGSTAGVITFERDGWRSWKLEASSQKLPAQVSGRIQSFLSTSAPLHLVVLDNTSSRDVSMALRIAYDLNAYHKLDAEIILGPESFQERLVASGAVGNILLIGNTRSRSLASILENPQTPFRIENNVLVFKDEILDEPGQGILFLHPHPRDPNGQMLFLLSTDASGLERAGRLFPIRTGVTVPDWLITSSRADQTGAGGVLGAGVWSAGWSWNEPMSWLY
ncbi:Transmembrane protein [Mycena sanguinolenta]|uniref:Transmembrane protein n=1 Tax=Mycena sanguinolenta TaxID=230812 RepID=A0A8H7D5C5_9AGAR|nr:Transmembrane protein [Mycena sanguinolenta]